jgi:hypothetical protein
MDVRRPFGPIGHLLCRGFSAEQHQDRDDGQPNSKSRMVMFRFPVIHLRFSSVLQRNENQNQILA